MVGNVASMREILFRRPRCRWDDTTEMDLRRLDVKAWIGFISLRVWSSDALL
jgi:hypothetical protein